MPTIFYSFNSFDMKMFSSKLNIKMLVGVALCLKMQFYHWTDTLILSRFYWTNISCKLGVVVLPSWSISCKRLYRLSSTKYQFYRRYIFRMFFPCCFSAHGNFLKIMSSLYLFIHLKFMRSNINIYINSWLVNKLGLESTL